VRGIWSDGAERADALLARDLEAGTMLAKQFEVPGGSTSGRLALRARAAVPTSRADSAHSPVASCAMVALLTTGRSP
jgi:phosphotransacetylase